MVDRQIESLCVGDHEDFKTKRIKVALVGWLSCLEFHAINQRVTGLIPGQGTSLGCEFDPWSRSVREATD